MAHLSDGYRPAKALNNYPLVSRLLSKQEYRSISPSIPGQGTMSDQHADRPETLPDLLTFEHDDHNS